MLFPPILILLDSPYANVRARATVILSRILHRIDSSILARTGLGEVIWTALIPNLSSLPPVTEMEDSLPLLRATYTASVTLARLWRPSLPERMALLDRLVRDGFIQGMLFAGDKIKVVQVQLESLDLLVREMGIYFVKHLKVSPFKGTRLMNSISYQSSHLSSQIPWEVITHHNFCYHCKSSKLF